MINIISGPLTTWADLDKANNGHYTHMTQMRWICPEYNEACNEVDQAWRIYDADVDDLIDNRPADREEYYRRVRAQVDLLLAAVAREEKKAAAYLVANEIFAAKLMADDIRDECSCTPVSDACLACAQAIEAKMQDGIFYGE